MFQHYGGTICRAGEIKHGKTSPMLHDGCGVFANVPDKFLATRYHSLVGKPDTLPDVLEITAKTENGLIMGVRHKELQVEGVQFHPESIVTEHGYTMIANFLRGDIGKSSPSSGIQL